MWVIKPNLIDELFPRRHFLKKRSQNSSTGLNIFFIWLNGFFGEVALSLTERSHLLFGELLMSNRFNAFVCSDGKQSFVGDSSVVDLDVRKFGN